MSLSWRNRSSFASPPRSGAMNVRPVYYKRYKRRDSEASSGAEESSPLPLFAAALGAIVVFFVVLALATSDPSGHQRSDSTEQTTSTAPQQSGSESVSVPEPSVTILSGLAAVYLLRRRRR